MCKESLELLNNVMKKIFRFIPLIKMSKFVENIQCICMFIHKTNEIKKYVKALQFLAL